MVRKPKIEINRAKNGEFFLRLRAANNKTVLTSGETYKSVQAVKKALHATKKIMKAAEVRNRTKKKI